MGKAKKGQRPRKRGGPQTPSGGAAREQDRLMLMDAWEISSRLADDLGFYLRTTANSQTRLPRKSR